MHNFHISGGAKIWLLGRQNLYTHVHVCTHMSMLSDILALKVKTHKMIAYSLHCVYQLQIIFMNKPFFSFFQSQNYTYSKVKG